MFNQATRRNNLLQVTLTTFTAALLFTACDVTTHPVVTESDRTSVNGDEMVEAAMTPGPVEVTRVVSAEWAVNRKGLINLDHPKSKGAGLEEGAEPIEIYFYVIQHPERGTYLVDSGVAAAFEDPETAPVSSLVASQMPFDALDIKKDTGAWIAENGPIDGLFLTHIHLDHITGLPDIPAETPVYIGPGEPQASSFENMFVQGTVDGLVKHLDPLIELEIPEDPSGRFEGVIDVFGDGSFFAIHAPGHTPGHLAFLARTQNGPVLMTGDTSHTAWGWKNGVEPGTFTMNHDVNAESLERLKALERDIPGLTVYLGHQRLGGEPTASR